MPFESVYRVSNRNSGSRADRVQLLQQTLSIEMPLGYCEYVTSFGVGTLCTILVVQVPEQILSPTRAEKNRNNELLFLAEKYAPGIENRTEINLSDFADATVLAYAMAESPMWFVTRTQGSRLFEYDRGTVTEIENGFFGLVERCTVGQHHAFPFFEPNNGRRRMRQLYIRPGIGRDSFVQAMMERWGKDSLRCSRTSEHEMFPNYFVSEIEGHMQFHLDPRYNRLPDDSFFVRACFDIDSEADFSAFVEPFLLLGGGPHEWHGKPIWLP